MGRAEALSAARRRGHVVGPWRCILGHDDAIVSCVCACGCWLIDLRGGLVGGTATLHGCTRAAEVFTAALGAGKEHA